MKAFIRIFEVVLASVIILSVLTYFFLPTLYSRWGDALLQTSIEDGLATLYKNGSLTEFIKNNDKMGLTNMSRSILPKTLDFSIVVDGIADPKMYVGCVCGSYEKNELESILSPKIFSYNERGIEIFIENGSLGDMIDSDADILFFFGHIDFSENEKKALRDFLEEEKSIFILSDLTEEQINDGFMNDTFGLESSILTGASATGEFYDDDASRPSFKVARYFSWINSDDAVFDFNKQEDLNNVMIDDKTVVKTSTGEFSLVKVNDRVINGKGRTIWFSDYEHSDNQINYLVKAVILWASEKFSFDPYPKNIPTERTFFKYSYFGLLNSEPFEIILTAWKIFY